MVSTFTTNINLEEPGHNDYINTWDVPVNANWSLIDTVMGGTLLLNATGLSGNQALTNVQLQPRYIQISGAPTGTITYVVPSGVGGFWTVRNTTTGNRNVGIRSNAAAGTVLIPAGMQLGVVCDGSNPMVVSNSVFDSSGVHFPDGSVQASAGLTVTTQNPAGSTVVNFTDVAATINALEFDINLTLSAPDTLCLRFYNSVGVLDTTAVYYYNGTANINGTLFPGTSGVVSTIQIANVGTVGPVGGRVDVSGIQRTTRTLVTSVLTGIDSSNSFTLASTGGGGRLSAGPITGVQFLTLGSATMTGHISMIQSG